jgi:hypothetical protein
MPETLPPVAFPPVDGAPPAGAGLPPVLGAIPLGPPPEDGVLLMTVPPWDPSDPLQAARRITAASGRARLPGDIALSMETKLVSSLVLPTHEPDCHNLPSRTSDAPAVVTGELRG